MVVSYGSTLARFSNSLVELVAQMANATLLTIELTGMDAAKAWQPSL